MSTDRYEELRLIIKEDMLKQKEWFKNHKNKPMPKDMGFSKECNMQIEV